MFGSGFNLGRSIYIAWKQLGITIDHISETTCKTEIWISVPETSDEINVEGNQMAGMVLARRIKETLGEMGARNIVLKAKIRPGDHWTKEKSYAAGHEALVALYGKEYVEKM